MKTIQVSEEQEKMIKQALQFVYDKKIASISQNRKIMSDIEIEKVTEQANKYYDLQDIFK